MYIICVLCFHEVYPDSSKTILAEMAYMYEENLYNAL